MTQNNDIIVPLDEKWELELTDKIQPDYDISPPIITWLKENMEQLTDDNDELIFNKVNLGYNEDNLKSFGNKPVCDVYINNTLYLPNFDFGMPDKVKSTIIFYSKGISDKNYLNVCKVHDYIMQEFITNEDFQCLDSVVRETEITNSQVMIRPIRKKWCVMGAFELSHQLF